MIHQREMSITHAEFCRLIKKTVADPDQVSIDAAGSSIRLRLLPGEIHITLTAKKEFKIGALSLPQTLVQLTFHALTEQQIAHYLDRFNLAFQRGGG